MNSSKSNPSVLYSKQQELFKQVDSNLTFQKKLELVEKINWDFKDFNTQYLTHKFHPYPARFIPQIPLTLIKLFTSEKETILDPFCGGGTSLVEAFLNNRNSIGVDFNPLGILISKVKTTLLSNNDIEFLTKILHQLKNECVVNKNEINDFVSNLPNTNIKNKFSRKVIKDMLNIRLFVYNLKNEGKVDLFDLGKVALSSVVWSFVNGYNSSSVKNLFLNKIRMMIQEIQNTKKVIAKPPLVILLEGDSRRLDLKDKCVDLIITSPPYVNAMDYYRLHLYNMFLLGINYNYFKKHEIGCHSHFIENRFRLLSEYLGDMLRSMIEMNRVLKMNKLAIIVIGNSSLEFELIESHNFFSRMSKKIGFVLVKVIHRNVDITKKYSKKDRGFINDEFILFLKKKEEINVVSTDDKFVIKIIKDELSEFQNKIINNQGTSVRNKKPSKERLLQNILKIGKAISKIPHDIRIDS